METQDEISGTRLVTQYKYHHGYFDGMEREFRGFGMVETIDAENFEEYGEDPAHYVAPVRTKTWYHTGAYVEAGTISRQYEDEYFQGDVDAFLLPDTVIDETSPAPSLYERREAYRALKGSALRQETYELGVAVPYEVKEANFIVTLLQRKGANRHSVFFTHANETITFHYEKIQNDPRIAHELTLEVDDYGNVTRSLQAVYPRRAVAGARTEQQKPYATLTTRSYINETVQFYRIGLPYEETVYELGGDFPASASTKLDIANMRSYAATVLSNVIMPETEFSGSTPQARMVSRGRQYFWNDAQSAALSLGVTTARALVHHVESAALTPGLAQAAYGASVTGTMLTDAGYTLDNGVYYNPGLVRSYAAGNFYVPVRTDDPFGGYTALTYDGYWMFPVEAEDALGNTTTALMDYRTLAPKRLTDANGNVSEAIADPMGMVIATSVYGSEDSVQKGDAPLYDSSGNQVWTQPVMPTVGDIIANPLDYLQEATTYFYYDLDAWRQDDKPPHFVEVARETHEQDLVPEESTRVRITIGFSDGFERELQTKVKVEPGDAWVKQPDNSFEEEYAADRWLVSGRTVYNNKGKPVKQYEPFYSGSPDYEDEEFFAEYGVTPILQYDPLLRMVRTNTPKGFFSKVAFSPWEVRTYDENDTVTDSDYYATYATLSNEEKEALDKAAVHYNTPKITRLDTLGREFMRIENKINITLLNETNRAENELITYTEFTITGKPKTIADPRQHAAGQGAKNYRYTHDMADRIIRTRHIDDADDRVLWNVLDNPAASFDAKGHVFTISYDLLQRPISKQVTGNGLNNTVEYLIYGEGETNAAIYNLRGKLYKHYDQAGRVEVSLYSFKGEPRTTERKVRTEYKAEVNWPETLPSRDALLETESYITDTNYDALGRVKEQTNPDSSISKPEYHLSGNLNKVTTKLKGETTYTEQISSITYNPKGQRERITYGNGTYTDYTYERETFRLTSLITTRTGDSRVLQNISYAYDPIGNITLVNDASIPAVFNNNQQVEPKQKYTYDALYRLIEAEGREHTALNNPDYYKDPYSFKQSAFIHLTDPNDDNKLANYTREYGYDHAGNLLTIQHIAADSQRSFTREINIDSASNRWLPANMGPNPDYSQYYDANGNITELEHLQTLTWNYRDNISSAVLLERPSGPNDVEYYVYDSTGQRVRKVKEMLRTAEVLEIEEKIYLGSVEIKKIRSITGGTPTQELARTTLHVMDDKRRIAISHNWTVDLNNREVNSSADLNINKTRYQYGNHLDSASLELDPSGNIISYEEYFPYGDTSFIAGTNQKEVKIKEYRYTGKEKDDATGLYYYGARYYASWLGRWMSCDPLFREQPAVYEKPKLSNNDERNNQEEELKTKLYNEGLNLYEYVKGNPVKLYDLKGTEQEDPNKFKYGASAEDRMADLLSRFFFNKDDLKKGQSGNQSPTQTDVNKISTGENKLPDFGSPLSILTKSEQLKKPSLGGLMSSGTGYRIIEGKRELHAGVDIVAPEHTPIFAASKGKISFLIDYVRDENKKIVNDKEGNPIISGFGYYARIEHEGGYISYYGHMNKEDWENFKGIFSKDPNVKKGDQIGGVGASGRSIGQGSNPGYHLHFEIRKDWKQNQITEETLKRSLKK